MPVLAPAVFEQRPEMEPVAALLLALKRCSLVLPGYQWSGRFGR